MKGKLLRGISGSIQPRRLLHGYQDAVFAWSGENPFANLAQSSLFSVIPRSGYSDSWIKSTPYGQAFRADTFSASGHGFVYSRHVPDADQTYSEGVTGYTEFVYSGDLPAGQPIQHLCCITSTADGNTGANYNGVLALGIETFSGKGLCPGFRVGGNTTTYGFAGGTNSGQTPVSIPVGAKVRQMVTFDPVSKAYASILTFNDAVYEVSGTTSNGIAPGGSSILVGGFPRDGLRSAYVLGMLEAAVWNRAMSPADMRMLLQQPSIFQPTEFIFPFSFGESSGGSEVINTVPDTITLSPAQAAILATEVLNTSAESLSLTPAAASIQTTLEISTAPVGLSIAGLPAAVSETINCTAADLALSGHGAGLVELSVIECSAGAVSVGGELCAVYQAQVISCSTAALALSAPAAQQVEVGDSVVGCVAAALTLTTPSAQQLESGDSVVGCTAAALAVSAPAAQQLESGDNAISCSTASLTLTAAAAQQLEVGDSVIGCAATIVSLDGTTATITDSMGVRSAAVVLSTPGCSIHDFDIIGAGQAALVTGSSAAALVESGEEIIYTRYADIGIAAAQCGIVQTDAEPIITDIGFVASIDQPTIYATIPLITIIARS